MSYIFVYLVINVIVDSWSTHWFIVAALLWGLKFRKKKKRNLNRNLSTVTRIMYGETQTVVTHTPEHLTWVEPCCLSCGALWSEPPVRAASEGTRPPGLLLLLLLLQVEGEQRRWAGTSEPELCSSGRLSGATVRSGPNPSPARLSGVQLQRCHSWVSEFESHLEENSPAD